MAIAKILFCLTVADIIVIDPIMNVIDNKIGVTFTFGFDVGQRCRRNLKVYGAGALPPHESVQSMQSFKKWNIILNCK